MIAIINDLAFSSPPVELSPGLENLVVIEENMIFLKREVRNSPNTGG
jgi:hypothetical protein